MPAVLVETGYVSNSYEASRLSDPDYQNQMARAIARGIMQYIQQNL
jgi:N-acetylmuramoyl-L-alanine amidase